MQTFVGDGLPEEATPLRVSLPSLFLRSNLIMLTAARDKQSATVFSTPGL